MTSNDLERLEKAHQAAQLLLNDLRDIHSKTQCVAIEELTLPLIKQVANLSRLLGRLASTK
jgi:hypothetical protein